MMFNSYTLISRNGQKKWREPSLEPMVDSDLKLHLLQGRKFFGFRFVVSTPFIPVGGELLRIYINGVVYTQIVTYDDIHSNPTGIRGIIRGVELENEIWNSIRYGVPCNILIELDLVDDVILDSLEDNLKMIKRYKSDGK